MTLVDIACLHGCLHELTPTRRNIHEGCQIVIQNICFHFSFSKLPVPEKKDIKTSLRAQTKINNRHWSPHLSTLVYLSQPAWSVSFGAADRRNCSSRESFFSRLLNLRTPFLIFFLNLQMLLGKEMEQDSPNRQFRQTRQETE